MSVAGGRMPIGADSTSSAGARNGQSVLCAKPFNPKGAAMPLVPNLNSDILKQKLAALNSKASGENSSESPPQKKKSQPPLPQLKNSHLKGKLSLKAPVGLPRKPVRVVEDATVENKEDLAKARSESAPTDPEVLNSRPKSGSVRENVSIFESTSKPPKVAPKIPQKVIRTSIKKSEPNSVSASAPQAEPKRDISEMSAGTMPLPVRPPRSFKVTKDTCDKRSDDQAEVPEVDTKVPTEKGPTKPQNIKLPAYPPCLDAWIRKYVLTNHAISPLVALNKWQDTIKTDSLSSGTSLESMSSQIATDEIYDDVTQGAQLQEDDIYDDAGNIPAGEDMDSSNPTYEVNENETSPCENRRNAISENSQLRGDVPAEDAYECQMLYEPVETIQTVITPCEPEDTEEVSKGKKKEERERREKEKKEKKEKEKQEKEKRKAEEEKKRREKEEKKRKAKERKMFGLKLDEELIVLERHFAPRDFKGKEKELTYAINDCIEIVSKENCPKGKWLAQNPDKKLGYIILAEFSIGQLQAGEPGSPKVAPLRIPTEDELDDDEELYEVINTSETPDIPPELPPDREQRISPVVQEELYDDVGPSGTTDAVEEEENLYQAI